MFKNGEFKYKKRELKLDTKNANQLLIQATTTKVFNITRLPSPMQIDEQACQPPLTPKFPENSKKPTTDFQKLFLI